MKKLFPLFFWVFSVQAAIVSESLILQKQDLEKELQINQIKIDKTEKDSKELAQAIHKIDQSKTNWFFFWKDNAEKRQKRKQLRKILSMSLRDKLSLLVQFNKHQEDLKNELALLQVKNKFSTQTNTKQVKAFVCKSFPLMISENDAVELDQNFGVKVDEETGVKWVSQGWWVNYTQGKKIRPCSPGKIVYNGEVKGRGRVVIVEHEAENISVYGNLTDENFDLDIGESVKNTDVIGMSKDRFYFEVRSAGVALNPRFVFDNKTLTGIGAL